MPDTTRIQFQAELAELEKQAMGALPMVVTALDRALETIQHQDVELASMVIADDDRIDGRYLEVHQGVLSLLALQAPVAGDLRLVAALLPHHQAHRAHGRSVREHGEARAAGGPRAACGRGHPRPDRAHAQARQQVIQCGQAFERRDVDMARDLVRQDDEIDRLNRQVFHRALEIGDDPISASGECT